MLGGGGKSGPLFPLNGDSPVREGKGEKIFYRLRFFSPVPRDDLFTALQASGAESLPSRTVPEKRQSCITAVFISAHHRHTQKAGNNCPCGRHGKQAITCPRSASSTKRDLLP